MADGRFAIKVYEKVVGMRWLDHKCQQLFYFPPYLQLYAAAPL